MKRRWRCLKEQQWKAALWDHSVLRVQRKREGEMADRENILELLSGWRGVQDAVAHMASLWVHTHYTPPPLMLVFPHTPTHTHSFSVVPHSWTHNLVPRWFMWTHMSMFSHFFHSHKVCVLTPFCILHWLHEPHLEGKYGIKSILSHITYNSVYSKWFWWTAPNLFYKHKTPLR